MVKFCVIVVGTASPSLSPGLTGDTAPRPRLFLRSLLRSPFDAGRACGLPVSYVCVCVCVDRVLPERERERASCASGSSSSYAEFTADYLYEPLAACSGRRELDADIPTHRHDCSAPRFTLFLGLVRSLFVAPLSRFQWRTYYQKEPGAVL